MILLALVVGVIAMGSVSIRSVELVVLLLGVPAALVMLVVTVIMRRDR